MTLDLFGYSVTLKAVLVNKHTSVHSSGDMLLPSPTSIPEFKHCDFENTKTKSKQVYTLKFVQISFHT